MPTFSRTARVSIVIPLQRNEQLFEETLLSVLEHQPQGCQVIAVHNGTYSDPFDLGDEVEFVTARSSNLVDLIRGAASAATAPIVHVLGTGIKVGEEWLADALGRFDEPDIAAVTPTLITNAAKQSTQAGWCDAAGRFCEPSMSTQGGTSRRQNSGFFLNAFLIRRQLLNNLLVAVAPAMNNSVAVSYAFGCLLNQAGWKVAIANQCEINAEELVALDDQSDISRGQCLAAIRSRILSNQPSPSLFQMLHAALLGSSSLGEMFGMLRHRNNIPAIRRAIDLDSVATVDQLSRVLSLPTSQPQDRRAA